MAYKELPSGDRQQLAMQNLELAVRGVKKDKPREVKDVTPMPLAVKKDEAQKVLSYRSGTEGKRSKVPLVLFGSLVAAAAVAVAGACYWGSQDSGNTTTAAPFAQDAKPAASRSALFLNVTSARTGVDAESGVRLPRAGDELKQVKDWSNQVRDMAVMFGANIDTFRNAAVGINMDGNNPHYAEGVLVSGYGHGIGSRDAVDGGNREKIIVKGNRAEFVYEVYTHHRELDLTKRVEDNDKAGVTASNLVNNAKMRSSLIAITRGEGILGMYLASTPGQWKEFSDRNPALSNAINLMNDIAARSGLNEDNKLALTAPENQGQRDAIVGAVAAAYLSTNEAIQLTGINKRTLDAVEKDGGGVVKHVAEAGSSEEVRGAIKEATGINVSQYFVGSVVAGTQWHKQLSSHGNVRANVVSAGEMYAHAKMQSDGAVEAIKGILAKAEAGKTAQGNNAGSGFSMLNATNGGNTR